MARLEVQNVTKRYDKTYAVRGVSFEAQPGRILGLLGPNGAGKTSIIRMITYITGPDSGAVLLDGKPVGPWSQEQLGYLPEERGLYKKMKIGDQLVYLAELKGVPTAEAKRRVKQWLERFDASDWYGKKTDELSKGMQQKAQFISTILHDPKLVILDEPFSGLDPINAELLEDVIQELKANGSTILFASHRMESVEQICDDICLISKGQKLIEGELREVKRSFGRDTVVLEFDGTPTFLDAMEQQGKIRISQRSHHRIEMRLLNGTNPRGILEQAMTELDDISRFEVVEPPLREIFVSLVQQQES